MLSKDELRRRQSEGGKKGGAKKKGKRLPQTIEREMALKMMRERVCKNHVQLHNAQFTLALGQTFLFKQPKGSRGGLQSPVIVTNPEEIADYLSGELEGDDKNAYYYITTKEPDGPTINALFDRTFGKPKEFLELNAASDVDEKDRELANKAVERYLHGLRKSTK